MMKRHLILLGSACLLGLAPGAPAASAASEKPVMQASSGSESQQKAPEELAREGIEKLMRALELLIQDIPQYEMPVINENGDIIIRRKNPRQPEPAPEEDQQDTPPAQPDSTDT
jgi:hypothetical protein